jgi:hypothetical protein
MAKTDLLKEAIADAKAVKETAIANAKIALEEAFGNRLQSMLGTKLSEQLEDEEAGMEDELGMDAEMDMEDDLGMDAEMDMEDEIGHGSTMRCSIGVGVDLTWMVSMTSKEI